MQPQTKCNLWSDLDLSTLHILYQRRSALAISTYCEYEKLIAYCDLLEVCDRLVGLYNRNLKLRILYSQVRTVFVQSFVWAGLFGDEQIESHRLLMEQFASNEKREVMAIEKGLNIIHNMEKYFDQPLY